MYMSALKLPQELAWHRIRRDGKCANLVCLKQNSIISLSDDLHAPLMTSGGLNTQNDKQNKEDKHCQLSNMAQL
ncbi:unnamed protein product [Aspergillus oryzae]|uniref:Unnamed protein product n=2 Tax=Aspergillus oryzae TaxID=5062 RepID=A0AAN4YF44_ASPOZ|nr:unnamed protein product [Aspergillus oryzae]GMF88071.1 unnamed protein product [Aspergillus oryzae]GMG05286.1 unnamed protein product [Aspergillus oryzae]GMG28543.1 unnamed protein product [Aspergillus oryzae]GMG45686.1 unnamed protein product [Aspergillus oryzae var. brunneus]